MNEKRLAELEKRVADLEKQVAEATTTTWDPQRAAELLQNSISKYCRNSKRGEIAN